MSKIKASSDKETSKEAKMYEIIKTIFENCEVGIHKDANGWRVSAKGPIAIAALAVLAVIIFNK